MAYDEDLATSWKTLGRSTDRTLRLHELSDTMLNLIMVACDRALNQWSAKKKKKSKGSHHVEKIRITYESAESIMQQRKHPRGLTRRLDFVPYADFAEEQVTLEMLRSACFGENAAAWLTNASPLPPVQMWAGHQINEKIKLPTLVALFARALRDDCCTSIQCGSVPAVYEARLTARNLLRIMNPSSDAKASVHKGRLVWIAEDSDLNKRFQEAWNEWENDKPVGLFGFQTNFQVGSMHMIESMDVTNSKMEIHPSVILPQRETDAAIAVQAEPEAEADLRPGAVDESIVTLKDWQCFCVVVIPSPCYN